MTCAVVVGGGMIGLLAARMLSEHAERVVVIENAPVFGGLLSSFTDHDGHTFDRGIHVGASSGNDELDALIYEPVNGEDWYHFDGSLREGHVFGGAFNGESGCLDARTLTQPLYSQAVAEVISRGPLEQPAHNLAEYLDRCYGPTLTKHVFEPVIRRLTGCPLDILHPDAHRIFSLTRLILFDSDIAREVKRSPLFDEKIAHARCIDGTSSIRKFYPRSGGMGRWINGLVEVLKSREVELLIGRSIEKMDIQSRRVAALQLDDGRKFSCSRLVWTVPLGLLTKTAGLGRAGPPRHVRSLALFHFTFDAQINSDLHWMCIYDAEYLSYRITFYPNLKNGSAAPPPHHITVEAIVDADADIEAMKPAIREEVSRLELVPTAAKTLYSKCELLRNILPVLTNELATGTAAEAAIIEETFDNVVAVGRGTGGGYFMHDLLRQLHARIAHRQ